jgi:hypothetical protein
MKENDSPCHKNVLPYRVHKILTVNNVTNTSLTKNSPFMSFLSIFALLACSHALSLARCLCKRQLTIVLHLPTAIAEQEAF